MQIRIQPNANAASDSGAKAGAAVFRQRSRRSAAFELTTQCRSPDASKSRTNRSRFQTRFSNRTTNFAN